MGHFEEVVDRSGFNNKPVPGRMLAGFCEYLLKAFNAAHANNARRIDALELRLQEVENKGVVYRGVFNPSDDYRRGDLVTYGGSIFHCTRPTQGVSPYHGDGAKAVDHPWQLAVKRGRDARGAT